MKKLKKFLIVFPVVLTILSLFTVQAHAAGTLQDIVKTLFGENTETIDIIILLTVLSVLPSLLITMTGFTRIVIVLSFMRNAIGMQTSPPNQVMVALALFLTMFVMGPVLTEVYDEAYVPYTEQRITQDEFYEKAMEPTRNWMLRNVKRTDLDFMIRLSGDDLEPYREAMAAADDKVAAAYAITPSRILIPAFLLSEIKIAFTIGFMIYIPFIVIDMVVASTLMAMGMMMLPPAMISLPFKVLVFVMVNGWDIAVGTIIRSFKG